MKVRDADNNLNLSKEDAEKYILRGQIPGEMLDVQTLEESIKNLDDVQGLLPLSLMAGMNPGETDIAVNMSNTQLFLDPIDWIIMVQIQQEI